MTLLRIATKPMSGAEFTASAHINSPGASVEFAGMERRGTRPRQFFVSLKRLSRFCTSSSWRFRLSISPAEIRRFLGVRALGVARRKWQRKHRKGALKQFHVPAHLFFQGSERTRSECLRHVFAKFFLLAGERRDRGFKEFRNHHLHIVAIETDQLAHERDGQEVLPGLALLLENDLREHRTGDILARFGIVDGEILAALDHCGEILQRHIGAGSGIIQAPIGVFLDDNRLFGFRHSFRCSMMG